MIYVNALEQWLDFQLWEWELIEDNEDNDERTMA